MTVLEISYKRLFKEKIEFARSPAEFIEIEFGRELMLEKVR
jgi:hypothetical protein